MFEQPFITAGMQGDRNCPMYLDDVRVPKAWRAAGPGDDAQLLHGNVVAARINTAALANGTDGVIRLRA